MDEYTRMCDEVARLQAELKAARQERDSAIDDLNTISNHATTVFGDLFPDLLPEVTPIITVLDRVAYRVRVLKADAVKAENDLDDLQHDVGVFAECGLFMSGSDKESLRSDDSIPLLETLELMKDRFNTVSFRRARWRERAERADVLIVGLEDIAVDMARVNSSLGIELEVAKGRAARLRDVLGWYANENNYLPNYHSYDERKDTYTSRVREDGGCNAKEALREDEGSEVQHETS